MIQIIGKNGSGKSYLAKRLQKQGFERAVSYTSRPKRDNEEEGIEYHFVTNAEFENLISKDFFVEYKQRGGKYYGIPKSSLSPQSIFVAGNLAKLRQIYSGEIYPVFINTELETRFRRVSRRKSVLAEVFKRFHIENFSYLDNFKALFVDNQKDNEQSIDTLLKSLSPDGTLADGVILTENYNFLSDWLKSFDPKKIEKLNDPMLMFLSFEEYLMRKLSLENDLSTPQGKCAAEECYMQQMQVFMKTFGINFNQIGGGFNLRFGDETFESAYITPQVEKI